MKQEIVMVNYNNSRTCFLNEVKRREAKKQEELKRKEEKNNKDNEDSEDNKVKNKKK